MPALQRAAIAAMPFALLLSSATDAQNPIREAAPVAAPQKPKSHHSFTDIFNGTVGRVLGVQIIPPRYCYKADPAYKTDIEPYIADQEAFADFMNKYKQSRALSEQETLEAIVELGIPQNAPDWLTPTAKIKIRKYMLSHKNPQMGYLSESPIRLAAADITTPFYRPRIISDVPVSYVHLAGAEDVLPLAFPPLFILALPSDQRAKLIGNMELQAPTLDSISKYFTPKINAAIEAVKDDWCNHYACQSVAAPQVVAPEVGTNSGQQDLTPCDPPEGTVCYVEDADHTHAGLKPHYHTWEMQRRWSTANRECYWRYLGGKVDVGTYSRPPDGVAPCSSFPTFAR